VPKLRRTSQAGREFLQEVRDEALRELSVITRLLHLNKRIIKQTEKGELGRK
jgi:hypothetical protein